MAPTGPKVDHRNTGTLDCPPTTEVGEPRRPVKGSRGGGASGVVRARESRVHGDGRQEVGTRLMPEERSVDSDHQADRAWLLSAQRKLYQWSRAICPIPPVLLESRMHNERCTSGLERGDGKPTSVRKHGVHLLLYLISGPGRAGCIWRRLWMCITVRSWAGPCING